MELEHQAENDRMEDQILEIGIERGARPRLLLPSELLTFSA